MIEDYTSCPHCDSYKTEVIDSYMNGEDYKAIEVWRCWSCGIQWEVQFDLTNPTIINIHDNN